MTRLRREFYGTLIALFVVWMMARWLSGCAPPCPHELPSYQPFHGWPVATSPKSPPPWADLFADSKDRAGTVAFLESRAAKLRYRPSERFFDKQIEDAERWSTLWQGIR